MANDLVDDVGLWSVVRSLCVSQVLGAIEDFEGEGIQELSLTENSVDGFYCESGLAMEVIREVVDLRDSFVKVEIVVQSLHLIFVAVTHCIFV